MQAIVRKPFSEGEKQYNTGDIYEGSPDRIQRLQFLCKVHSDGDKTANGEVYTVTEQAIEMNPEMKEEGVKEGDVIELGEPCNEDGSPIKEKAQIVPATEKKKVNPASKKKK